MHSRGHRQDRATNTSVVMSPASTNADVNSTQTMGWCVNIYGAAQYLSQLPVMGTSSDRESVACTPLHSRWSWTSFQRGPLLIELCSAGL